MRGAAAALVLWSGCGEKNLPPPPERVAEALGRTLGVGCRQAPHRRIQDAIDAAASGDTIVLCRGTYAENLRIEGKRLTIRSRRGPRLTVIDAGGLGRALEVDALADVTIEGVTFRNGFSERTGGNVWCGDSELQLVDVHLESGAAGKGGGLGTTSCVGELRDSQVVGNWSETKGGGVYAHDGFHVLGSWFEGNEALEGGGAYIDTSFAEVADNHFLHNVSEDDGAGLFTIYGAPLIDHNVFEYNHSSEEAGGLRVKSGEAVITDNHLFRNHADWRGGGAKVSHDEVVMAGNTFIENDADGDAGALLLYESASLLTNEVYARNEADDGGALAVLEGWGSLTIQDSLFDDNEASDQGGHLYIDLLGFETRLRRVVMRGGRAELGGAVYATSESALEDLSPDRTAIRFENTLFEDHEADLAGGVLYLDRVTGSVTNSLIINGEAPQGAGMAVMNGLWGLRVVNTIFSELRTGAAVSTLAGFPPTVNYSCFADNDVDYAGMVNPLWGGGNTDDEPEFLDAARGDYRLESSSDLIDDGDPTIDDRDGTRSDIGLFGGPEAAH